MKIKFLETLRPPAAIYRKTTDVYLKNIVALT